MNIKLYLCGPITGIHLNNEPLFRFWQEKLIAMGYNVIVPHDLDPELDMSLESILSPMLWKEYVWRKYMNVCLPEVCTSHVLCTLADWENSRGSKIEVSTARGILIPVLHCHAIKPVEEFLESQACELIEYI